MSEEHSLSDVAAALNERIEDLALHLLGAPNRGLSTGSQLRYANKGSVAVDIAGDKAGKWYDHESGTGGDGLALVCHVMNLHNGRACDWARNWLGLSHDSPIKITTPASLEKPEDDKTEKLPTSSKAAAPSRERPPSVI